MTSDVHGGGPAGQALRALGWDDRWSDVWNTAGRADRVPARVVARHRSRWVVAPGMAGAASDAVAASGVRPAAEGYGDPVDAAVGDWVVLEPAPAGGLARIEGVLPRRTAFVRKAAGNAPRGQVLAANVDAALIVVALTEPVNERRLERYVATAYESGASPAVLLAKADLVDDATALAAVAAAEGAAPGVDVVVVSAAAGTGLETLEALLLPGRTGVLLGASGAGKSTLLNRLLGEARLRTAEVRPDGKGRHTTTHRELVRTPAGQLLIDTPGMRELGLWNAGDGVEAAFPDIETLARQCRFRDCGHDSEPGCAVLAAAADRRLDPARLDSWRRLRRELAFLERKTDGHATARENARVRALHRAVRRDRGLWSRE